jgi:acyl-CoA synthetase (AMP-forming)/AMP-acid ligase II
VSTDLTVRIVGDFFSEKLLQKIIGRMTKKILYSYGLTEMGAITFSSPICQNDLDGGGVLVKDIVVECVDMNDKPVLKNEIGQIRIKYSEMPKEYFMDTTLSGIKFKNGWYYTGDNGILTDENKLIIKGRDDDVVNIGGTLTNLNAVKDTIQKIGGVLNAYAFGKKDGNDITQLYIAIISDEKINADQLKKMCSASVKPSPKKIFILNEFPLNSNGKIDRKKLEDQVLNES